MSLSVKRYGIRSVSILLFILMLFSMWVPIAKATTVAGDEIIDLGVMEITGQLDGGKFKLSPEVAENLFDIDGAVYPGGTWKKTVRVINSSSRSMYIALISVTSQDDDRALFDALETEIFVENETVYNGSYGAGSEEEPITETFRIPGGKTMEFDIFVSLNAEYGNELQGKPMNSLWTFGAYYNYPPKTADYHVYYVDESGNDLHDPKTDTAKIGTTVTEQAIEIDGYTPDAQEKSIEINKNEENNIIKFIYAKKETVIPDDPDVTIPEPDDTPTDKPGESQTGKPQPPKTGVELEDNSILLSVLAFATYICVLVALIILFSLIKPKNKYISDSSNKEE